MGDLRQFQHVLWSLGQDFQFVVIDMPSVSGGSFPLSLASILQGLLIVIDARSTRRKDVDRVFRQLTDEQILGLVVNRYAEDE